MTAHPRTQPRPSWPACLIAAGVLALCSAWMTGCDAIGWVAKGIHDSGSTQVAAKYHGLEGKTFAVIVDADRAVQADYPGTVTIITTELTRRIAAGSDGHGAGVGAAGVIPAEDVLRFQGRRPGWVAMNPRDLAKELGVDRLILIDISEYRLTDPGNSYVWNGIAAATVGVVEADSKLFDDYAFRERVQVKFPDKDNVGAMEIPGDTVQLELLRRFVNRCTWLFFDHEESNIIEY